MEDTEASLNLTPTSFKALRTRARIYLHLEKFDEAINDFKSAIQQAQTEGSSTDADVRALKTDLKKAEVALKRSKTKDYYKILGVHKGCNDGDIKKAYRRESLKHHPDKVSFFFFGVVIISSFDARILLYRVVMRKNSNWSSKPTLYFRIPRDEQDTTWVKMKTA